MRLNKFILIILNIILLTLILGPFILELFYRNTQVIFAGYNFFESIWTIFKRFFINKEIFWIANTALITSLSIIITFWTYKYKQEKAESDLKESLMNGLISELESNITRILNGELEQTGEVTIYETINRNIRLIKNHTEYKKIKTIYSEMNSFEKMVDKFRQQGAFCAEKRVKASIIALKNLGIDMSSFQTQFDKYVHDAINSKNDNLDKKFSDIQEKIQEKYINNEILITKINKIVLISFGD